MFNRLFKGKPKQKKVSEMLLDVASEFLAMGEDILDKQQLLNAAVSAWNIASLKGDKKQQAIKNFLKDYRKLNPSFSKQDYKNEEENIYLLIRQKDKLYPGVNIQIVNAVIHEVNGQNHITVASAEMKQEVLTISSSRPRIAVFHFQSCVCGGVG
jgi:hypothetical protein